MPAAQGRYRLTTASPSTARSCALPHESRGAQKHHGDEEGKGEHVAPFEVEVEAADRDDLGEDECRDEAAPEVAEAAQHADQERDGPEREPHEGMHVVL